MFLGGAALAVLTSACSLITSLDGLTDGPTSDASSGLFDASTHDAATLDGASTKDGSTTVDDAGNPIGDPDGSGGAPDAGDDGGSIPPVDAGNTPDASDGGTVTDTGTPFTTFCAGLSPKPVFCEDYDEGSVSAGWDQVSSQGGKAGVSTTAFQSGPASMLVATNTLASGGIVDVAEYKEFPALAGKAQTMTLAFDVRFETIDSTKHDIVFGSIQLVDASGATYELQLDAVLTTAGDLQLDMPELTTTAGGGTTYVDHTVSTHVATQTWLHVVMTEKVPAASGVGAATLSINGTQLLSTSINVLVTNWTPELIIGISYVAPPSNPWGVRYDNVTLDSK